MDNKEPLFHPRDSHRGYGDDLRFGDFYHGGGYGYLSFDSENKYGASGTGGELAFDPFPVMGYGQPYPGKSSGSGGGDAYGYSWSHGSGYGHGRSDDYYAAGYGAVNQDDMCEDGHGDGGMYDSESLPDGILYYHTYNDFNAYGGRS